MIADPDNPIVKNLEHLFSGRWELPLTIKAPKLAAWIGVQERAVKPFQFFEEMTKKLIEDREKGIGQKNDFLQIMIDASKNETEANKKISQSEMMAQCVVFIIAGFDTTATLMACCAYHLAKHPEVQEKLTEEVSNISIINHDTVMELKYLDAVLKECFRLTPPVFRVQRQCVAPSRVGNVQVEPGTIVCIPVFAMHRDPGYFNDPETFDPNRFLEGGADVDHHPYAFLPFGGGPRMCIAQRFALLEAKMAIALVMQEYHFETTPETMLSFTPDSVDLLAPKAIMLRVKRIGQKSKMQF
jgi:cytochrome P450